MLVSSLFALMIFIAILLYLLACSARPNPSRVALDSVLAAEGAGVSCVLRDFDLLDLFAEGGTVAAISSSVSIPGTVLFEMQRSLARCRAWSIPCAVFTGDANLLRSLRHFGGFI
jgi:hypothetical protein